MVSGEVKWVEVNKDVYNIDSGEVKQLKFLQLGHINKYNKEMGSVDLADQLRGSYCLDKNRKTVSGGGQLCFGVLVLC